MMKSLNQLIHAYTAQLQQGEMHLAYRGIFDLIGKLRARFMRNYPSHDIGSIYPGYMDMTYFSLTTEVLKAKGLKIPIVYMHEKGAFEVWLSARNREIARKYGFLLNGNIADELPVFHDEANQDAIIECTIASAPDFGNQEALMELIDRQVQQFINAVSSRL
ncbi:DUF7000 family protein [Planococcus plakortidis]|uniref:DUF7000 family protein n=1 Tax=Planococcus plakortidis TaxID=1038856 RepID=UPI0039853E9F